MTRYYAVIKKVRTPRGCVIFDVGDIVRADSLPKKGFLQVRQVASPMGYQLRKSPIRVKVEDLQHLPDYEQS